MRITIADETAEAYEAVAAAQSRPLDAVLDAQLARFTHCPPGQPALVLGPAERARLATALGVPVEQLHTTDELVRKVEAHGQLKFENVTLPLTPTQKAELAARAAREETSVKVLTQRILDTILADFLWTAGPATPLTSAEQRSARQGPFSPGQPAGG